jgi:hypothetical protein
MRVVFMRTGRGSNTGLQNRILESRSALAMSCFFFGILTSCGATEPPRESRYCDSGCPEGLRCYAPTNECVFEGVGTCESPCASYEQCSARADAPTCYAQICSLPPAPPTPALKVIGLEVLGDAGGCDLDGDGTGDAELASVTNVYDALPEALADAIGADRITMFVNRPGGRLELLFGTLAPDSLRCDPASPVGACRYTITKDGYDRGARSGPCPAWLTLPDEVVEEARVTAGGAVTNTGISVPVEGQQLLLQMYGVRADGTLSTDASGDAALEMRFCGAVPEAELVAALEGLPPDTLEPVGGLATARRLLALALNPDIDGDGDGVRESLSFALRVQAIRATTVGWSPDL